MAVRQITDNDIPALFVVRPQTRENAMTVEELRRIGITEASIRAAIKRSHKGWLFEDEGRVCGFAMGDASNAEVTVMAMLPAYEGRGIGAGLLTRVEDWLSAEGCDRIWLTTDTNPELRAYGFYLRQGWHDWKIEHGLRYLSKPLV